MVSRLRYLTNTYTDPADVPERFRAGFDAYRDYRASLDDHHRHLENYRGYLTEMHPDLEPFVDRESITTVCLADTPERIADELREMSEAGIDQCGLQIAGSPPTWFDRMESVITTVS